MTKLQIFLVGLSFIYAPLGRAEDYLLRFEIVGFEDIPATTAEPKDVVFNTVELVCRPDVPAGSKVQIGKDLISVAATLRKKSDQQFLVDFNYCFGSDVIEIRKNSNGAPIIHPERTRAISQTSMPLNVSMISGGTLTEKKNDRNVVLKSKKLLRLTVLNYEPKDDDELASITKQ